MRINVRFFAVLKEMAGADSIRLEMERGSTLADLKEKLKKKYGKSLWLNRSIVFAVNGSVSKEDVQLNEGDEVALLPPVSGGR